MPRFDTGKALNIGASELEKQQREMLAKTKERNQQTEIVEKPEITSPRIVLVEPQSTERITLRLPKNIHESMKLIARFEDKSLNTLITQACLEFIGKEDNQEKIKKYQKIL